MWLDFKGALAAVTCLLLTQYKACTVSYGPVIVSTMNTVVPYAGVTEEQHDGRSKRGTTRSLCLRYRKQRTSNLQYGPISCKIPNNNLTVCLTGSENHFRSVGMPVW